MVLVTDVMQFLELYSYIHSVSLGTDPLNKPNPKYFSYQYGWVGEGRWGIFTVGVDTIEDTINVALLHLALINVIISDYLVVFFLVLEWSLYLSIMLIFYWLLFILDLTGYIYQVSEWTEIQSSNGNQYFDVKLKTSSMEY